MKKLIYILFTFTLMIGCSNNNDSDMPNNDLNSIKKENISVDDIAQKICDCLLPLVEINIKMEDMQISGDTKGMRKSFEQLIKIGKNTAHCNAQLKSHYKDHFAKDSTKIIHFLKTKCPDVALNYEVIMESLE